MRPMATANNLRGDLAAAWLHCSETAQNLAAPLSLALTYIFLRGNTSEIRDLSVRKHLEYTILCAEVSAEIGCFERKSS